MKKLDQLYATWKSLQPLESRKQYLLSQRFLPMGRLIRTLHHTLPREDYEV